MKRRTSSENLPYASLILGVVITPVPAKADQLIVELSQDVELRDLIELGEPGPARIPAMLEVAPGRDEETLARIERLPSVLRVDVVFAQGDGTRATPTERSESNGAP